MIGLNRISTRNKTLIFIVILLLGFSFRLSYTYTRGFKVNLRLFAHWARLVAREGLGAVVVRFLPAECRRR